MADERCPCCGTPVRVVGETTLHYEAVLGERIVKKLQDLRDFYARRKDPLEFERAYVSAYEAAIEIVRDEAGGRDE